MPTFCEECGISLDLHDGPDSCEWAQLKADGLTCDICGAELADWAAADEHMGTHEGWAG